MTPETKVKNAIQKFLKEKESTGLLKSFRRDATGANYQRGLADCWFLCDGKHVEVEYKSKDGEQSPDQIKWMLTCRNLKIDYWLVAGFDEFVWLFTHTFPNVK